MARPRKYPAANDPLLLAAALEGLELQKARIDAQIKAVRAMLGKGGGGSAAAPASAPAASKTRAKRELSEEARKRIAAAQKKRWAEFRKNKANS